jgi:predicted DNA-binding transcriptional regulator YafY
MADLETLSSLKVRIDALLAVTMERAAELCEVSIRTMYRHRDKFETCRRKGHIYISVQSIIRFVAEEKYRGNKQYDLTRSFKSWSGRTQG